MASGKQTSFQYGEVSPLQHYRSNDAEYSNALHSLHNMTVKRTGGITRRMGTESGRIAASQVNVSSGIPLYQKFKTFSYQIPYGSEGEREYIIISFHVVDTVNGYVEIRTQGNILGSGATTFKVPPTKGLAHVKVVSFDDGIFIHGIQVATSGNYRYTLIKVTGLQSGFPLDEHVLAPSLPTITTAAFEKADVPSGIPTFSAQYLVTLEFSDGREIPYTRYATPTANYDDSGRMTAGGTLQVTMPGNGVVYGFKDTISVTGPDILKLVKVNVYRSEASKIANSLGSMVLVARIPQDTSGVARPVGAAAVNTFDIYVTDTGASIPSISPPVDLNMFIDYGGSKIIEGTSCSVIHQSRHIMGFNVFNNINVKTGDMAVSKIGAPLQIARPIISRSTEAFSMSIPTKDGSPVIALASSEDLIAFSSEGAYVIKGGDNGILTPTVINPHRISIEGSSKVVSPIVSGSNIIYLNTNHTKLMMVIFGPQGQAGVVELSRLSNHLLDEEEFIEMQVIPGADKTVLLLKKSGELISATVNEERISGFSSIDLSGGVVETMSLVRNSKDPALQLSIIRNGVRLVEYIADSSGINKYRTQSYSDNSVFFGSRLLEPTELGYPKIPAYGLEWSAFEPKDDISYQYLNITTGSDYLAGSTLTLTTATQLDIGPDGYGGNYSGAVAGDKIKFLYPAADGTVDYLYLTLLDAGVNTPPWTYTARADIDIPAYLQDVDSQSLTTSEKNLKKSRWTKAVTSVVSNGVTRALGDLYISLKEGATSSSMPDGEVDVSVFADGKVFSSPLNYQQNTLKLISSSSVATITFPEPISYAEIGIPYESYMQTLPIEAGEGRTLTDDKKIVNKVGIALYETVGGFVGVPGETLQNMTNIKTRDDLDPANTDLGLSGYIAPIIPSKWKKDGMIKIRQVDPAPMTILSVYPKGLAGD